MEPSQRGINKAPGEDIRSPKGPERPEDASDNGSAGNLDKVSEQAGSEERLRFQAHILDAVGQAIIATDPQGKILYWNRCAEQLYGWSAREVMGRTAREFLISEESWENAEEIMSGLRAGRSWSGEFAMLRKDGTPLSVQVTDTPVRDEGGDLIGIIGVSTDVTQRKATEAALRHSEERFRRSFDYAAIGMALVATDGRFLQANRSLCETVGYTEEEMLARSFQDITHPEDLDKDLEQAKRLLAGEIETYHMEKRYLRKDGSVVWILLNGSLVRDEEGGPLYFLAQVQDISGRKSAEERLREAEERYRTLVEQIPAVTYVDPVDDPDTPLYTSPHIERMLGYTPEEWIEGKLWLKRLHSDDRERVLAADERFEEGSDEFFDEEYRLLAKDGSVVWVREEAVVLRDGVGKPLYWQGIMYDVTKRREAEEALRRSEERYRTVV